MIKIGVISDTHGHSLDDVAGTVLAALSAVDIIVHAGDFTRIGVWHGLCGLGDTRAVHGNMDSGELKELLPEKLVFEAGGIRIGVTHGSGAPWGLAGRVRRMFDDAEIIIFGHSHQACNEKPDGCLMFNPGTASRSFGVITIGEQVEARIIRF